MSSTTVSMRVGSMTEEQDLCRLVLLNSAGTDIFIVRRNGQWRLPEIQIPRFSRFVEEITNLVRSTWSINTTQLFSNYVAADGPQTFLAVLEVMTDCEHAPDISRWPIAEAKHSLQFPEDVEALKEATSRVLNHNRSCTASPFARLGWIYDLQQWVQQVQGVGSVNSHKHISGSDDTCLARFDTLTKTLWYKAVGQSDPKEYAITSALREWIPDYLPRILAFDPVRNAWLMESGGETDLGEHEHFETWAAVASRLAEMQIASISYAPKLLAKGCIDARAATLRQLVAPFFDSMATLMQQQVKPSPAPLTRNELKEIAEVLTTALTELDALDIPEVIGHSDFNPGNILINEKIVFVDWSAAHVGNPYLTLEYLIAHFRRSKAILPGEDTLLRQTFLERWSSAFAADVFRRARNLTPIVAVFASAVADDSWRDQVRLDLPGVPGYLRSLTRIMGREAQSLNARRE